jgi:hypothetical protein
MTAALLSRRTRYVVVVALVLGVGLFLLNLALTARGDAAPPAPRITSMPGSADADAVFSFAGTGAFECAVDTVRFVRCSSPVSYGALPLGSHVFMVRAVSASGVSGDLTAVHWIVRPLHRRRSGGAARAVRGLQPSGTSVAVAGDPLPVAIDGDLPSLLSPGHGGAIPLRIENPYPYAISVTEVRVTVDRGSSHAGCDGRTDLAVRQSNTVDGAVAIEVPATSTVTLPAGRATAPMLWMRNRAINQDACKGARFTVRYSGVARRVAGG